ncbi:unnamed protein product [Clavelina lepadiformis]|uniref:pyridoxal 5'-phosphate synthase n=1 Tax=Clavelina lepadiformis TaxID=159417 RepID=A0ABP0FEL4_CLALP
MSQGDLVSKDPFKQFDNWFKLAKSNPEIVEPHSMTLATVKEDGRPAARTVLLMGYDEKGFKFFTNNQSAKASELTATPYASLVFYWVQICRSIRIEGKVEKLPQEITEDYFARRPQTSQLAALISPNQSSAIESRSILTQRLNELQGKFKDDSPPLPEFMSAYIVIPDSIEFWQGQSTRMHDRILFTKKENRIDSEFLHYGENGWVYQRLEP